MFMRRGGRPPQAGLMWTVSCVASRIQVMASVTELLNVRGKPPPFRNTLLDYVNNSGRAKIEDFQSWTRVREPGTPKPNLAAPGSI